jgi:ribosomal protein L29
MATGTRKAAKDKTQADWEADVKRLEAQLAAARTQVAASKVENALNATNILAEFKQLRMRMQASKVTDIELLLAVGNALGIKRLEIKQAPPTPRTQSKKKTEENK